jgi:hypothetical protein
VLLLSACFWCGSSKNGITHVLLDYIPCDTCKVAMSRGITVAEVNTEPYLNQDSISDERGIYPTGVWGVLDFETASKILGNNYNSTDSGGIVCMLMDEFRRLGLNPKYKKIH